jgi:hypothetical protein
MALKEQRDNTFNKKISTSRVLILLALATTCRAGLSPAAKETNGDPQRPPLTNPSYPLPSSLSEQEETPSSQKPRKPRRRTPPQPRPGLDLRGAEVHVVDEHHLLRLNHGSRRHCTTGPQPR